VAHSRQTMLFDLVDAAAQKMMREEVLAKSEEL